MMVLPQYRGNDGSFVRAGEIVRILRAPFRDGVELSFAGTDALSFLTSLWIFKHQASSYLHLGSYFVIDKQEEISLLPAVIFKRFFTEVPDAAS